MGRALVATLVVLPLALLAAGCGGDTVALDLVAQAAKKTQTDMTITRFGGPVGVQAPPDDQVLDAGDLQ